MSSRRTNKKARGDSQYFTTTKKGEIHELKNQLHGSEKGVMKDAVKKVGAELARVRFGPHHAPSAPRAAAACQVIAAMTVGKDVSSLFPDVLNCMQTADLELKKLVYLYLINYSKSNPDLAIMAVNTFVRDSSDPNPLIRALAVRTMGCIRVERITEYLCDPLRKTLNDEDPYVRKTAAVCVAKLFDISPGLVEEQGFLDILRERLGDSNPTVVSNSVAALGEIEQSSGRDQLHLNTAVLQKLLAALNECTEWGQVYILDSLAKYEPADAAEAESIVERVTPRLQHANAAVVLSATKIVLQYSDMIENPDTVRALSRKLAPPLVTLLSAPSPELQYVALRNINLIVQKRPEILSHEVKVFFCKYNDPIYVKMEKLEIMIKLASERNVEQVLLELKEYATEVDVDFVRRSVRAIGRCAIKIERAAERCINVLLDLILTKVNYVVQEAIVVIKDIFRKYPNRYETIIALLCDNLESLDEPEAKAAMIWIIGEYADRIETSGELLESFVDSFHDEPTEVQLQLLTAVVKLFLRKPSSAQDLVQNILRMATEDSDNPDLRDRGFVYWRLLSSDPNAARSIVLAEKPVISDDAGQLPPELLQSLVGEIATLASVYHKPPEAFVRARHAGRGGDDEEEDETESDSEEEGESGESEDDSAESAEEAPAAAPSAGGDDLLDLGGFDAGAPAAASASGSAGDGLVDDIFGMSVSGDGSGPASSGLPYVEVADASTGKGLRIEAAFSRADRAVSFHLRVTNTAVAQPVGKLAVQFNKNTFGLTPSVQVVELSQPVSIGSTAEGSVPIALNPQRASPPPPSMSIQVAAKNFATNDVIFFTTSLPFDVLFTEDGQLEHSAFGERWQGLDASKQVIKKLENIRGDHEAMKAALLKHNVFCVGTRRVEDRVVSFFSIKTATNMVILLEITTKAGVDFAKLVIKAQSPAVAPFVHECLQTIVSQ